MCVAGACDKPAANPSEVTHRSDSAPDMPVVTVTRQVPDTAVIVAHSSKIPESPGRIISLAPNITELLFALGVGDRVVGVTRFCDYPEQVSTIPRVGGFIDPDLEAMLAQSPDLVLGMKAGDASLTEKLDKASLPYVFFEMNDLAQTREGLIAIGSITGQGAQAKALVEAFDAGLNPVKVQDSERPRTLFLFGHDPMIASGHGTFAHELMERAGARNAIGELKGAYPKIDMEFVLKLNPEVIIDATMVPGGAADLKAFWAPYDSLLAQKKGKIIHISDPAFLRPGPRLPDALSRLKAVYGHADEQAKEEP